MSNQPPRYGRTIPGKARDLEEASLGTLHDLVGDALGWVDGRGAVHAIGSSMEELLCELSEDLGRPIRSIDDLPLDKEDASALRALLESNERRGELVCALHLRDETRYYRVRIALDMLQGGWFVALHDETRQRRAEAEALRLSRLRAIGAVGAGIAQDLCDLLTSVGGMAEHLTERITDTAERQFLEDSLAKARAGQSLLLRFVETLRHARCDREALALESLIDRALELFGKSASLRGVEIGRRRDATDPLVRVVPADAVSALLRLLLAAAEGQAKVTLVSTVETLPAPSPRLPARGYGVVRISIAGDAGPWMELAGACVDGESGLVRSLAHAPSDRSGIFLALLPLVVQGARFTVESQEDGSRHASLWLPAARAGLTGHLTGSSKSPG